MDGHEIPDELPMRIPPEEFDRIVQRAIRRVPARVRATLDNMLITVRDRASAELLEEMGLPPDEPLLGVYDGIPLPERSVSDPPLYPDTIVLFQEAIESVCDSTEEMEREIEITVVHEIAHFLGMDEEELIDLGYG